MVEEVLAFVIWTVVGCCFIAMGIGSFFSRKAVGFWSNVKMYQVREIKKYNSAVGKLFVCYGMVFIALGIPLLRGQNAPAVLLLSVLGVMLETIALMAVYGSVITPKYKSR